VLIVEDDATARRATARILRKLGFAVFEAASVADATGHINSAAAESHAPQWILLDLMLPDGNGIDIMRLAHARRLPSRICIITGCGSDRILDAQSEGAQHIFTKPLDVARLMALLRG
jgi:DNA-binding response OmpR family regulator